MIQCFATLVTYTVLSGAARDCKVFRPDGVAPTERIRIEAAKEAKGRIIVEKEGVGWE